MTSDDEEVKYIDAAIAALNNTAIPPAEAAEIIAASCEGQIQSAKVIELPTNEDGDTPDLENFCWGLFNNAIEIACEDTRTIQRISDVFRELKAIGRRGCDGWQLWVEEFDWEELPLFGPSAREGLYIFVQDEASRKELPTDTEEAWHLLSMDATPDPTDTKAVAYAKARAHWLNQYRFFMRIWADRVHDFSLYAIWAMREGLETLDLDQPEKPYHETPRALAIETAAAVIEEAAGTIYRCRISFNSDNNPESGDTGVPSGKHERWHGIRGFHPDRWALWKDIFGEVAENKGKYKVPEHVVGAAKRALAAMGKAETGKQ